MSGQWRKLFGAKCAQDRGNTTYTWEASALQILISGAPREIIHKNQTHCTDRRKCKCKLSKHKVEPKSETAGEYKILK